MLPLKYVLALPMSACSMLSWLNWAYFLSYIKLAVSLVKYIPQVSPPYFQHS